MSPEEEIVRAGQARAVLDSVIFKEARDHITSGIQAQMASVGIADQTQHTRLIMMLQLWNALEKYLDQIAETGKLAAFTVAQEEERKRRLFGSLRG